MAILKNTNNRKCLTSYQRGYRKALMDIAEKLNNATANGSNTHHSDELFDQLAELADGATYIGQPPCVTLEKLLVSGQETIIAREMSPCPKCGATTGNDWSQCKGECPMPPSPYYKGTKFHKGKQPPDIT